MQQEDRLVIADLQDTQSWMMLITTLQVETWLPAKPECVQHNA